VDQFQGASEDIGTGRVFGGQVLGQALVAACRTATSPIHSLHAYFLLPGDHHQPIDYLVERVRDGRSFATRRVVAQQKGRTIFTMMASFHAPEAGSFSHQHGMPPAPPPEGLRNETALRQAQAHQLPPGWRGEKPPPIEYRMVDPVDLLHPIPRPADIQLWLRACAAVSDDPVMHRALLAYASDHGLLRAALLPHGLSFMQPAMRGASLDHAMWFHRDFRIDDWLLYCIDSPSAGGARALCRGEIYTRDGQLAVSVAQEGMLRVAV
jgi:acyl-CoA thioesterase-2